MTSTRISIVLFNLIFILSSLAFADAPPVEWDDLPVVVKTKTGVVEIKVDHLERPVRFADVVKFLKAEHPLPSDWKVAGKTGFDFETNENIDDRSARSIVFHFELMIDQTDNRTVVLNNISFGYGWPGIDLLTAADRCLFNPIRRSLGGKLISDVAFGQVLTGVSSSTKHCLFASDDGRLYLLDSVSQNSEAQFSKFIERLKAGGPVIDVRLQGLIDSDYFHVESITSPSVKFESALFQPITLNLGLISGTTITRYEETYRLTVLPGANINPLLEYCRRWNNLRPDEVTGMVWRGDDVNILYIDQIPSDTPPTEDLRYELSSLIWYPPLVLSPNTCSAKESIPEDWCKLPVVYKPKNELTNICLFYDGTKPLLFGHLIDFLNQSCNTINKELIWNLDSKDRLQLEISKEPNLPDIPINLTFIKTVGPDNEDAAELIEIVFPDRTLTIDDIDQATNLYPIHHLKTAMQKAEPPKEYIGEVVSISYAQGMHIHIDSYSGEGLYIQTGDYSSTHSPISVFDDADRKYPRSIDWLGKVVRVYGRFEDENFMATQFEFLDQPAKYSRLTHNVTLTGTINGDETMTATDGKVYRFASIHSRFCHGTFLDDNENKQVTVTGSVYSYQNSYEFFLDKYPCK